MKGNIIFVFDFDQTLAYTDVEKGRDSQWLDLRGFIRYNDEMLEFLKQVRTNHKVYLFTTRHPDVLDRIYEKLHGLIPRENMYARRFALDKKSTSDAMRPENRKAFIEKVYADKYQRLSMLAKFGSTVIGFDDEYLSILDIAKKQDKLEYRVFLLPPIESD